jgi:hypothetical protein
MGMTELLYVWPHTVNGKVIGEIRRLLFKKKGEKLKADIPYYTPDGDDWAKGVPDSYDLLPLFGIDSVTDINAPLIICEGQKANTAWQGLGYQCVNNLLGSSAGERADWQTIKTSRKFWIAPDKDPAGEKLAEVVWNHLRNFDPIELKVIRLPGMQLKDDICDWLKRQPELKDWNELDPLHGHPARAILRARLDETIEESLKDPPSDWIATEDWQAPLPIDTALRPVHRLHNLKKDILPPAISPWLLDVQRRVGCPLEYLAVSAFVHAGATIGTSVGVRPKRKDTWTVIPNMWGIGAGPVSTMKTYALLVAGEPLRSIDSGLHAEHVANLEEHNKKKFVWEQKMAALRERGRNAAKGKGGKTYEEPEHVAENLPDEPETPPLKRFVINDSTIEAVGQILANNPRGVLLFQDELYNLLKGWDREGRQSDRPFYLMSWNGNIPWTIDRATKAQVRIPNLCVSIIGGMQPDTLRRYVLDAGEDLNDGLIQRFQLMVYLDKQDLQNDPDGIDDDEDADARRNYELMFQQLGSMNWLDYGAQPGTTPFFRFGNDAQLIYAEWADILKEKIKMEENPFVEQHLAKYSSLMPSLALVFHCMDLALRRVPPGPVTGDAAQRAADWCEFLEEHARRVYAMSKPVSLAAADALASNIRQGKLPPRFALRDIMRKNWRMLKQQNDIMGACRQLSELNWLKQVTSQNKKGGPPKVEFLINPEIQSDASTI